MGESAMVRINVSLPIDYDDNLIYEKCREVLHFAPPEGSARLLRLSVDTSGKVVGYKAWVGLTLDAESERKLLRRSNVFACEDMTLVMPRSKFSERPVVVGSGPCGLFAALVLAESGANPIVLERGLDVDSRIKAVEDFKREGRLDENSNIQFGEGGAGTFSDGKLKCGSMDRYKYKVLSEFVRAGAPESILYDTAAHIGTDVLCEVVKSLRKRIIGLGGEFIFSANVVDIATQGGKVCGVKYVKGGEEYWVSSRHVIFATGHSARDVFRLFYQKGVSMEAKPFGVGVRIEHKREHIDRLVYGDMAHRLGAASYHLVEHLDNGRSVYSFCMCPGGEVVAAASEHGGIVTNGMSASKRDGENSNAAFLVSVFPSDFPRGEDIPEALAGLELQRQLEARAFDLSGSYRAPVQRMEDFLLRRGSTGFGEIMPTYPCGTVFAEVDSYLPPFIAESLREAIPRFDSFMKGFFCPDALLTGVETRSTSPVRVLRSEGGEALGICGLYPCGEGAGYAGGIVSSAVDGIRSAEKMILS